MAAQAKPSERERDKQIAKGIGWTLQPTITPDGRRMRWMSWHDEKGVYYGAEQGGVPEWHTDARDMVQLIEGMRAKGWHYDLLDAPSGKIHAACFTKAGAVREFWDYADTLMAAVAGAAWAALAAVEEVRT